MLPLLTPPPSPQTDLPPPLHPPHSGDSSEPSPQSSSWSQTKCLGMHCRFPHMNSLSSQVLLYTVTVQCAQSQLPISSPQQPPHHPILIPLWDSQQPAARVSSAPSAQSLSPSQSQRSGTQTYVPGHWKDPVLHVVSPGEGIAGEEPPTERLSSRPGALVLQGAP